MWTPPRADSEGIGTSPRLWIATLSLLLFTSTACGSGGETGPAEVASDGPSSEDPPTDEEPDPSPSETDAEGPSEEVSTPVTSSPIAAAAGTADDTFDPAFYDPDAGNFPALDDPVMVTALEADWMRPDDIVMGISRDGESRAFPVDLIAFHHVANTRLAGEPFVVTY